MTQAYGEERPRYFMMGLTSDADMQTTFAQSYGKWNSTVTLGFNWYGILSEESTRDDTAGSHTRGWEH